MILPSPLIAIATAVLLTATSFGWGYIVGQGHGRDKVQAAWDRQRAADAEARAAEQSKARQREHELQRQADQKLREKTHENAALARRAAALADSLRERPEARLAPADVPQAAGPAAAGCTGAGLARPDAEFLVRAFADAARLQLALDQCRAGYQAAKDSLDGATGEVSGRQAP
ncbi:MAG: hypothetical protein RL758_6 [Pseudomonadota bacterium]|jgi:hypothetical protein